jgi:uncharacterized protein with ATP-grasp and redox domains
MIVAVCRRIGAQLARMDFDVSPPENSMIIYDTIREMTGIDDIYQDVKHQCTEHFLKLYPHFQSRIERATDPLLLALQFAAAGNAIDLGANPDFELNTHMEELLREFTISDYIEFRKALQQSRHILYLADNAGETIFDRLLIQTMNKRVFYAVRSSPIINDAIRYDAKQAGIDAVAEIVESGCTLPGTILSQCSAEFTKLFNEADIVISKGQGNFETLSHERHPIFFLLKVKCSVVARQLGVNTGALVFFKSKNEH